MYPEVTWDAAVCTPYNISFNAQSSHLINEVLLSPFNCSLNTPLEKEGLGTADWIYRLCTTAPMQRILINSNVGILAGRLSET